MTTIGTAIVVIFVLAVLAIVVYVIFEMSPFATHAERYRDPQSGKRLGESPHLETWDEFERRTHDDIYTNVT